MYLLESYNLLAYDSNIKDGTNKISFHNHLHHSMKQAALQMITNYDTIATPYASLAWCRATAVMTMSLSVLPRLLSCPAICEMCSMLSQLIISPMAIVRTFVTLASVQWNCSHGGRAASSRRLRWWTILRRSWRRLRLTARPASEPRPSSQWWLLRSTWPRSKRRGRRKPALLKKSKEPIKI